MRAPISAAREATLYDLHDRRVHLDLLAHCRHAPNVHGHDP